jgi:hypothetical protein
MNGTVMKKYLKEQFKHFNVSDVWPGRQLKEAAKVFLAWSVPAFLFVVWATTYHPSVKFYQDAIAEGIGPNLWNVLGSFGNYAF